MNGRTRLIVMCVCASILVGFVFLDWHRHNMFGFWITLAILLAFYPAQIWSAINTMKHEKSMAEINVLTSQEILKQLDQFNRRQK